MPARDAEAWRGLAIDWGAPWLAPYRDVGAPAWRSVQSGAPVHKALEAVRSVMVGATSSSDAPSPMKAWRFAGSDIDDGSVAPHGPSQRNPKPLAFEERVRRSAAIPSRDNLHDFFHGLVWLVHPAIKARLNALHVEALRTQATNQRGPLRDALTLFDEDGLMLNVDAAMASDLRARAWQKALHAKRSVWLRSEGPPACIVFGHAMLEKLCTAPRKALTGHALERDPMTLSADEWARKPCFPLPVLGVPGWCAANEDASYYNDTSVFRALTSN